MFEIISTEISDVKIIKTQKIGDHRGFFSETYSQKLFAQQGVNLTFVQDNHSLSVEKGVVRGLHFQMHPFAQDKLVRVIRGGIYDVAVDLRKNSPTFGKHVGVELTAENWLQLLVPIGFAHGFCTLTENTEVVYKVTNFYSAEHDRGVLWNDPKLNIKWPVKPDEAILSEKDKKQPLFDDLKYLF